MLFMVTQSHKPEACPIDTGDPDVLIDKAAQGITVNGRWGDLPRHVIRYLVDADSVDAVQRFLDPEMKICTSSVAPVTERTVQK
jgi:hypothetical protein